MAQLFAESVERHFGIQSDNFDSNHFDEVYQFIENMITDMITNMDDDHDLVADIDSETLIRIVKFVERGKVPGPDNIHNEALMSQSIPTGYIPRGLAKKLARGVGIWLLKFARGPGIRQKPGFCGKWKWNFKIIAWIKFLQVKTKQVEFLTFFEVYVFSQWNFSWSMGQFFGSAVIHTEQKIWRVALGLFIWRFHRVMVIHTHFFL